MTWILGRAKGSVLLIRDSCFKEPNLSWPQRFAEKCFAEEGAVRVREYEDIRRAPATD